MRNLVIAASSLVVGVATVKWVLHRKVNQEILTLSKGTISIALKMLEDPDSSKDLRVICVKLLRSGIEQYQRESEVNCPGILLAVELLENCKSDVAYEIVLGPLRKGLTQRGML